MSRFWSVMMTEDEVPPTPLPPAAQPPYPAHPAPHAETPDEPAPQPNLSPVESAPAIGALGVTLIGGAVAAAVGLFVAIPLFRRRRAGSKAAPKARRPRRKQSN
jgi:hypothetical protein